jgi:putative ABC transport system ATP-binding protein
MEEKAILVFKDVSFAFSEGAALFRNLSIEFKSGSFCLIRGPSGVGKSTLLRLMNRMEEPAGGEILFRGQPLPSYAPPILRSSIVYIQQTPVMIDGSVRDNLLLPFTFKCNRILAKPNDGRLKGFLKNFLLESVALDHNAKNLSVGQLQRLSLIRGMLLNPEILLMDEPTSALDEQSRSLVETIAERSCLETGLTMIMVSHRNFRSARIRPRVLELSEGSVREVPWDRIS